VNTYTLQRVSLWSLAKVGFFIGWIVSFLPIAFFSFLFFQAADVLAKWIGSLVYRIRLPLPGDFGIDLNLVEILKLQNILGRLQGWAAIGAIQAFILVFLLTCLAALLWAIVIGLAGLIFNLISRAIGGIQVTLIPTNLQVVSTNTGKQIEGGKVG
jgi:hypothetical protein